MERPGLVGSPLSLEELRGMVAGEEGGISSAGISSGEAGASAGGAGSSGLKGAPAIAAAAAAAAAAVPASSSSSVMHSGSVRGPLRFAHAPLDAAAGGPQDPPGDQRTASRISSGSERGKRALGHALSVMLPGGGGAGGWRPSGCLVRGQPGGRLLE